MAIKRQMQPARIAALQGLQLLLSLGQGGQYLTGEGEQLAACRGQHQRAAFAQVKLQIEAGLQLFELVGEGALLDALAGRLAASDLLGILLVLAGAALQRWQAGKPRS